nr:HNH endonuclease family protein [Kibdelosporangium banguiense]
MNRESIASSPPVQPAPELASLAIAPAGTMSGYSRDRFPHWAGSGTGDSCDTREIVLQRQGTAVARDAKCRATSGKWLSPYDGAEITEATKVDIDHVVPLAEAWRSGAATWTDERRKQFANDLDHPQLIAVTAASNRSKGDQDPATWKPPTKTYWCTYAKNYITVKVAYQLTVDQKEHDALATMLTTCPAPTPVSR